MLRNIKNLSGYKIQAKDGNIGEVYDFFFDDEAWAVRYLIADVETWLLDRKVSYLQQFLVSQSGNRDIFPLRSPSNR